MRTHMIKFRTEKEDIVILGIVVLKYYAASPALYLEKQKNSDLFYHEAARPTLLSHPLQEFYIRASSDWEKLLVYNRLGHCHERRRSLVV